MIIGFQISLSIPRLRHVQWNERDAGEYLRQSTAEKMTRFPVANPTQCYPPWNKQQKHLKRVTLLKGKSSPNHWFQGREMLVSGMVAARWIKVTFCSPTWRSPTTFQKKVALSPSQKRSRLGVYSFQQSTSKYYGKKLWKVRALLKRWQPDFFAERRYHERGANGSGWHRFHVLDFRVSKHQKLETNHLWRIYCIYVYLLYPKNNTINYSR